MDAQRIPVTNLKFNVHLFIIMPAGTIYCNKEVSQVPEWYRICPPASETQET